MYNKITSKYNYTLTGLTPTYCHACPKRGPWFSMPFVTAFFEFNDLRSEMVVHFVDIDRVVDHHCFNFFCHDVRVLCSSYPAST